MAEPPELQELAKRYLDLWQDQLRAMAADPETMATFTRLLSAVTGQAGTPEQAAGGASADGAGGGTANPFAWWPMAGAMPPLSPPSPPSMGGATPFDSVFAAARGATETRAEAAAAASRGGGDELYELERRLAALEARIAALEPVAGTGRGGGSARPRKGKR